MKFELDHDQFFTFRMNFELGHDQFCVFSMKSDISLDKFCILQSIKFDHLRVQAGSDSTGVATDMITMNSTLKFTYRNTGTFFGVHVTSTPLELSYSDIVIASGNVRLTNILLGKTRGSSWLTFNRKLYGIDTLDWRHSTDVSASEIDTDTSVTSIFQLIMCVRHLYLTLQLLLFFNLLLFVSLSCSVSVLRRLQGTFDICVRVGHWHRHFNHFHFLNYYWCPHVTVVFSVGTS